MSWQLEEYETLSAPFLRSVIENIPSILVFSHLLPFQLASLDGTAQVG